MPVGLAARRARRWLLPGWGGGNALLSDAVLGLALIVVVSQVLGTAGWFGTAGLVLGLVVASGAVLVLVPDTPPPRGAALTPTHPVPRWHLVLGAVAVLPVAASWAARAFRVLDEGIRGTDTVWYHLPAALRFLESGETTTVQFFDDGPLTAYFPMTSSLLHATGMALFGSDLLSAVVNLAALGMALLAAWRFGARFGVAVPAAVAALLFLGSTLMVETQAATALNDVIGLALLLAAVAVVSQTPLDQRLLGQDVVAGLALGLAIGMKVTFLVPAGLLALGLVVLAGRERWTRALLVYGLTSLTGIYWYVRNVVAAGSPVPVLDAGLGPLQLTAVTNSPDTKSVSVYLFDGNAWRDYLAPGFVDALGLLWPAFLALVFIGLIGGVIAPPARIVRLLALVGIASFVAFLFTPQYLDLGEGKPFFFPTNLRYGAPAFTIGLLLGVVVLRRFATVLLPLLVGSVLVAQADPAVWPVLRSRASFFKDQIDRSSSLAGVLLVLAAVALVAVVAFASKRTGRRLPTGALVLAASLIVVLAVAAGHNRYIEHRYDRPIDRGRLYPWARDIEDSRIGSIGLLGQLQYPLAGKDLSNHVDYLVVQTPDGGARPPQTCEELMGLIERGRYDYAVVLGTEYIGWARTQPDAVPIHEVFATADVPMSEWDEMVFDMDPDVTDRHC